MYLTRKICEYKTSFELSLNQSQEIYSNLINLLNETVKFNENEDIICAYFYKPVVNRSEIHEASSDIQLSSNLFSAKSESNSLTGSFTSINSHSKGASNNYLLSFYEYAKTLYEYFREKSLGSPANSILPTASCFSILEPSPDQ